MSNSAFDIYLGDVSALQGYRCRSLQRDSAPLVANKFSTGAQGQTDLDLLKSVSIDSLSGGMFQRDWQDPEKVARAVGIFNPFDKNTYPAPPSTAMSWTGISINYQPNVKAESENYSFIALKDFSAGTYYNQILMVSRANGNFTKLTLPAPLASNTGSNISGMCLHKGALFIASQNTVGFTNIYRYDIDANTFQDIGGSGGTMMFATMRGSLYAINRLSQIYSCTNEMVAGPATFTYLADIGFKDYSALPQSAVDFNGAMWVAKYDGIYRFDGVTSTKVLALVTLQLQVFNGAMYFMAGSWFYRFDGTNVTKLQFFGNQEYTNNLSMSANSDYLFLQSSVLTTAFQGDKISTASALTRIYTYDGAAFMLFNETAQTLSSYAQALMYNAGRVYDFLAQFAFTSWTIDARKYDLTALFNAASVTTGTNGSKLEFTTAEFDDGFPNIFKSLEVLEANYSGLISGDSLAISYQYYDGKTWSAWIAAGTLTSTTGNSIELTDATKKLFKRLKVNITLTLAAGSTASLKGGSLRYTLQPRARWRWQATIMAEGNSTIQDRNGNDITADANSFTNSIDKAIKQKTPIFMLSPDYGIVKTGINNVALSFIVMGQVAIYTDPYSEYSLCAVKNNSGVWEVLRVATAVYNSGTDETTITVLERGYYGVTAGTINANAEFHIAYKTYITRLMRDAPILDDTTYNEQPTTGESQLQREYLLEITQV